MEQARQFAEFVQQQGQISKLKVHIGAPVQNGMAKKSEMDSVEKRRMQMQDMIQMEQKSTPFQKMKECNVEAGSLMGARSWG